MAKKELTDEDKPKALTFFLLGAPTVLIIALAMITPDAWWAQILIAVYQFIMLKQFVDRHYDIV